MTDDKKQIAASNSSRSTARSPVASINAVAARTVTPYGDKSWRLRRAVLAGLSLIGAWLAFVDQACAQHTYTLGNYTISNDGRYIGAVYGFFEWRTGKYIEMPEIPDLIASSLPAFSTDGTKVAIGFEEKRDYLARNKMRDEFEAGKLPKFRAKTPKEEDEWLEESNQKELRSRRIAIFDFPEMTLREIHQPECRNRSEMKFQPGDRALLLKCLIAAPYSDPYLALYDLQSRTSRTFLQFDKEERWENANGSLHVQMRRRGEFFGITSPTFIGPEEILFTGQAPEDAEVKAETEEVAGRATAGYHVTYRMKLGEKPHVAYRELVMRERVFMTNKIFKNILPGGGPTGMQAARDGHPVVFAWTSENDQAEALQGHYSGRVSQDLFAIDGDAIRQVTNLNTAMGYVEVSYDGAVAGFGAYSGPPIKPEVRKPFVPQSPDKTPYELQMVDLRTGQVTTTGFVAWMNEMFKKRELQRKQRN